MAISVGTAAPDFTLKDQNQKEVKSLGFQGKEKSGDRFLSSRLESRVHE